MSEKIKYKTLEIEYLDGRVDIYNTCLDVLIPQGFNYILIHRNYEKETYVPLASLRKWTINE